jgi:hypothetical protein
VCTLALFDIEKMWNLDHMQTYASFMLAAYTTLAHHVRSDIFMGYPVGLGLISLDRDLFEFNSLELNTAWEQIMMYVELGVRCVV